MDLYMNYNVSNMIQWNKLHVHMYRNIFQKFVLLLLLVWLIELYIVRSIAEKQQLLLK